MNNKDIVSVDLAEFKKSFSCADFDNDWENISQSVDITDQLLKGNVSSPHDFENHNFVRCFFEGNKISGFHILHMDFKDTTFSSSHFITCNIESSAFINCVFNDVVFFENVFFNCTFQDCRFYGCSFKNVDLGNAFIKGCRISNCCFDKCVTENHVFEECLFSVSKFKGCSIQIDAIFKNYGITSKQMSGCSIRNRRLRENGIILSLAELNSYAPPEDDLIAQLRWEYFKADTFINGNTLLDTCLSNNSWLVGLYNDFTLGDRVSQFVEFLINLWEQNEISCHTILLAHQMTNSLVEALRDNEQELYRVLLTIMGTHMLLSRKVESYLSVLDHMYNELSGKPLALVVDGPADTEYYKNYLPELFCAGDTEIVEVRPHNSPSELYVCGMTVIAWFLASLERFKLEAYAIQSMTSKNALHTSGGYGNRTSISLSYNKGKMLELRARALLPFSSMLVDMDLAVSTKVVGKFRSLIVGLLQDDPNEQ